MNKEVDYTIQDGKAVNKAVEDNFTELSAKGFKEARKTKLVGCISDSEAKNIAQTKAVKFVNDKTAEQNAAAAGLLRSIVKIQNASRSAFGEDPVKAKRYRIGEIQPRSLGKSLNWGNDFRTILVEDGDVLLENGLVSEDITDFNNFLTILSATDTIQENAKKLQSSATSARDASIDVLKAEIKSIRNFVKAAFDGDKEMLIKFKPIPKGHGGGGNGKDNGENPPSPEE